MKRLFYLVCMIIIVVLSFFVMGFEYEGLTPYLDHTLSVPSGSAATEITVLNPKSYPELGGFWQVNFTTEGTADLLVEASNGTKFGKDLTFISMRCGEGDALLAEVINNQVLFEDYSCDGITSFFVVSPSTVGKHDLHFMFGDSEDYAHNTVYTNFNGWTCPPTAWYTGSYTCTKSATDILVDSSAGNYMGAYSPSDTYTTTVPYYARTSMETTAGTCVGGANSNWGVPLQDGTAITNDYDGDRYTFNYYNNDGYNDCSTTAADFHSVYYRPPAATSYISLHVVEDTATSGSLQINDIEVEETVINQGSWTTIENCAGAGDCTGLLSGTCTEGQGDGDECEAPYVAAFTTVNIDWDPTSTYENRWVAIRYNDLRITGSETNWGVMDAFPETSSTNRAFQTGFQGNFTTSDQDIIFYTFVPSGSTNIEFRLLVDIDSGESFFWDEIDIALVDGSTGITGAEICGLVDNADFDADGVDGAKYCCDDDVQADDTYCASSGGFVYDWVIDGTQCTGEVYDPDGTINSGDDSTICNCESAPSTAYACDSADGDATVDGICVDASYCAYEDIVYTGSLYDEDCYGHGGARCDTDTSGGAFSQNGMCFADGGGSHPDNYDCETSGYIFYDGSIYEDDTGLTTTDYDYDSDTSGKGCDSTLTSGAFSTTGMVTTSGCTSATGGSDYVYLASGTNYFTAGCTNGAGEICDSDITTSITAPFGANGVCISGSTCDTGDVYYDDSGSTYYGTASTTTYDYDNDNNGDSCDSNVGSGGYSRDGMVVVSGGSLSTNCDALGGVVRVDASNNNYFVANCDSSGDFCDTATASSDEPYTTNGICASSTCDTSVACNDSGTYFNTYAGCGNTSGTDSTALSDGFTKDGIVCSGAKVGDASSDCCTIDDCSSGSICGIAKVCLAPRLLLPSDITTSFFSFRGHSSGPLGNTTETTTQEFMNLSHGTYGQLLELTARFDVGTVDLRNLVISATDAKTVVDFSSVTNAGSNHTIFIPRNNDEGGYICPDATTLPDVTYGCSNQINFSHDQALANTWIKGILFQVNGSSYKISNLTGTGGGGDSLPPRISFEDSNPIDGFESGTAYARINVSITEGGLNQITYQWNGSNFTLYNDSLLLMLNFDNQSELGENDSFVVDLSNYDHNGTIEGAYNNFSGKYKGAINFDGKNDFINTSLTYIDMEDVDFTATYWIRINATPASGANIMAKCHPLDCEGTQTFLIEMDTVNRSVLRFEDIGAVTSNSALIGSDWHHLAFTYNASSEDVKIYINGILDQTGNVGPDNAGSNAYTMTIGGHPMWGYFNGSLDDIRIYNRTLSPNEVYQQFATNLYQYNTSQWYLEVNQSRNATIELNNGTYPYYVRAVDQNGNSNETALRYFHYIGDCGCRQGVDWEMDCSNNCIVNSACDTDGGNFHASGTGTLTMNAKITGWNVAKISGGCDVVCTTGDCFGN